MGGAIMAGITSRRKRSLCKQAAARDANHTVGLVGAGAAISPVNAIAIALSLAFALV